MEKIMNGLVTGSQYHHNNQLCVKEGYSYGAEALVFKILKKAWQPDTAYVLDVAETIYEDDYNSRKTSLLELGSINCAGLYKCNIEKFVVAISKQARMEREFF